MPYKSLSQSKKCFALKSKGQAKGWDCKEWAEHTDYSKLPEKKSSAAFANYLGQLAANINQYNQRKQ